MKSRYSHAMRGVLAGALLAAGFSMARADNGQPAISWNGFSAGGSLGVRSAPFDANTDLINLDTAPTPPTPAGAAFSTNNWTGNVASLRGALHGGYNWQSGVIVIGVEGDIGFAGGKAERMGFPGPSFGASSDTFAVETGFDGSLRLRAGVLVAPATLFYATGGLAYQDAKITATCAGGAMFTSWCSSGDKSESHSKFMSGWTLGGGAETALSRHWLARLEYRHSDFGHFDYTFFGATLGDTFSGSSRLTTDIVNVGFTYKY